jgi:hypothetical protein
MVWANPTYATQCSQGGITNKPMLRFVIEGFFIEGFLIIRFFTVLYCSFLYYLLRVPLLSKGVFVCCLHSNFLLVISDGTARRVKVWVFVWMWVGE